MVANKTIVVTSETKERMEAAKIHERETFDDQINRILDLLPRLTNQKQLNKGVINNKL